MQKLKSFFFGEKAAFDSLVRSLPALAVFLGSILFWETSMQFFCDTLGGIDLRFLHVVLFSVFFAGIFWLLSSFFPKKINLVLSWIYLTVLYLWYASQLIYNKVFGGFFSASLMKQGGAAVTNFFKETVNCVVSNFWILIILAIPFVAFALLLKFKLVNTNKRHAGTWLIQVLCLVLVYFASY